MKQLEFHLLLQQRQRTLGDLKKELKEEWSVSEAELGLLTTKELAAKDVAARMVRKAQADEESSKADLVKKLQQFLDSVQGLTCDSPEPAVAAAIDAAIANTGDETANKSVPLNSLVPHDQAVWQMHLDGSRIEHAILKSYADAVEPTINKGMENVQVR
eukprot:5475830-Alexandrium_andersonii.AAC.1